MGKLEVGVLGFVPIIVVRYVELLPGKPIEFVVE
jgi:hypothetical protein